MKRCRTKPLRNADHFRTAILFWRCPASSVPPAKRPRFLNPMKDHNTTDLLKMDIASFYLPKDNPDKPLGEDSHFVCRVAQTIGIADGVGGWQNHGVDSGEYARQLMHHSASAVRCAFINGVVPNPKKILETAYEKTTVQGSSTALIITVAGNKLHAANVGDSGFLVIRDGGIAYRSPFQQWGFNCPYQLGTTKNSPSVAKEIELFIKSGDLIVAGTDGLLDNVYVQEIMEIVNRRGQDGLPELGCYLANTALYNSFDRFASTPYSDAAAKAGIQRKGGKVDDITVVIARIV